MEHHLLPRHRRDQIRGLGDVALEEGDRQVGQPAAIGLAPAQYADVPPRAHQLANQIEPEQAGAAGDQALPHQEISRAFISLAMVAKDTPSLVTLSSSSRVAATAPSISSAVWSDEMKKRSRADCSGTPGGTMGKAL